jgi:hypothetical protein
MNTEFLEYFEDFAKLYTGLAQFDIIDKLLTHVGGRG